jgi:hypothetical protein
MENVQLTVADLASLKSLIEAACTRGAFKAAEMSVVGNVYDKLTMFVDQTQAQVNAQQAQGDQNA